MTGAHVPYLVSARLAAKRVADRCVMAALDSAMRVLSGPLLRSVIGRWPQPHERASFTAGLADGRPPLLQALARVDAARPALIAATAAGLGRDIAGTPRLAYMHLEKTAGSSVLWYLESLYGTDHLVPRPPAGDQDTDTVLASVTSAHRLLRGHFTLPFLQRAFPGTPVLTVLREPRARILSCYYYWRSHRDSTVDAPRVNQAARAAARLPLLDFLRLDLPDVHGAIDNLYVRRLTGADFLADGTLAAALSALGGLDMVGVSEQLDRTLAIIARHLGVRPPMQEPRINIGADNAVSLPAQFRAVAREPVTPAIAAELDRLTRLDRIVYAAALQRIEQDGTQPAHDTHEADKGAGG